MSDEQELSIHLYKLIHQYTFLDILEECAWVARLAFPSGTHSHPAGAVSRNGDFLHHVWLVAQLPTISPKYKYNYKYTPFKYKTTPRRIRNRHSSPVYKWMSLSSYAMSGYKKNNLKVIT